ncbi:dienelactone hydrolase [Microdochium trichocladiopsis]|uniref:Dienelactone hydrolase n=1 Tax=Microdochium trichocladiopsis TaxID=1682393 RepID=A0A9P9BVZ4_9PEZI|nr:dienelactone hydrolase [Microdochium trichocladiopsis]KAH7034546.1 dienelactone hydrolase [Microdochium trichocladiopsis]
MVNINFPGFIDVAAENRDGRRIQVLGGSMARSVNRFDQSFLSSDFPRSPPKLYITAETDDFDSRALAQWRNEGFDVEYLPMGKGGSEYSAKLHEISRRELGPCERFGIVAYGDAAAACLLHFHNLDNDHELRLGCLVAYYPGQIPDPESRYPGGIQVLVHFAGGEVGVVKRAQLAGIQGKDRARARQIDSGLGVGGRLLGIKYPAYSYDAEPGFAEHDLKEYDPVSAELAWTRSLSTARKAFQMDADLETVVDTNIQASAAKFFTQDVKQTMSTFTNTTPHVTHMPTLTGGIGASELQSFYADFFVNTHPETLELTLVSRTIGVDRVVDELHVSFKHTEEMPWILPNVPPTNRRVEIMIVSIVAFKAGRLQHEHVYWDQASVLMQVGLLDPKLLPERAKEKGATSMPVVGKEAARRMLGKEKDYEQGQADNELIPSFWGDSEDVNKGSRDQSSKKKGKEPAGNDKQDRPENEEGNSDHEQDGRAESTSALPDRTKGNAEEEESPSDEQN